MRARLLALLAASIPLALGIFARPAAAQGSGNGFLFQQPSGSVTLSGGYSHANAGSDLFSFTTQQFTLNRSSFSGPVVGADVAFNIAPRFDLVLGVSYNSSSSPSHYRKYVDQNNQEITQTTDFTRIPVMLSARAYLTDQGRSIGKFAWVPARFVPYVGAGAGAMQYTFEQKGDFVDYQNSNSVFSGDFKSSGWTPAVQGLVGANLSLSPRLALNGEAKYIWARGSLNQSFSGFNKLDLSGFTTTLGLTIRY
ncbi:MAG: hypothetical protein M3Z30_13890 [Gemmatimonadota bacterium]|nr:hypothetical protein [Gemmatimonadota bacterium]